MAELQAQPPGFFVVEVTETWSASCQVLVAAPDAGIARQVAEDQIDFDFMDAESDGVEASVRRTLTLQDLADLSDKDELGARSLRRTIEDPAYVARRYQAKIGNREIDRWDGDDVPLREFLDRFASPEAVAAFQLAMKEANNGQLPLIGEAAS